MKREPRKAKKWAKKNGARLISVSGKRFWYCIDVVRFPYHSEWYQRITKE